MEEIVKAFWSFFQHDGVVAFILSPWSPWPPARSAKEFPGGWTKILNVHRICRINGPPVATNHDSTHIYISDTKLRKCGMAPSIISMAANKIVQWTMNPMYSTTMRSWIRNAPRSRIWVLVERFPDMIGKFRSETARMKWYWWRSILSKCNEIMEWRNGMTQCIYVLPASRCSLGKRYS
jgi:hypothetical protein